MKAPPGQIADVVRFSWVDGPGNRFVVFLQGCNLNCLACHNPHTIPCQTPRARGVEVADLVEEIRPLAPFLGGVTVSGGEATLQAPFVRAFFAALAADPQLRTLTRFIDSNGVADAAVWQSLLPVTDGVMLDLKAFDPAMHRYLTGSDNAPVLDSIRDIAATGKLYEVRLLLVPGVQRRPGDAGPNRPLAARRRRGHAHQGDRLSPPRGPGSGPGLARGQRRAVRAIPRAANRSGCAQPRSRLAQQ